MAIPLHENESVLVRHPGLQGHIVMADQYNSMPPATGDEGDVMVVGMVNYEGKITRDRAHNLRQLFGMAGSLSRLALLTQIMVVRPQEDRVIVCDYYRYATDGDKRYNLSLRGGDIVVVPRIYSEERYAVAPEWGPIERYFLRQISLKDLFRALDR